MIIDYRIKQLVRYRLFYISEIVVAIHRPLMRIEPAGCAAVEADPVRLITNSEGSAHRFIKASAKQHTGDRL